MAGKMKLVVVPERNLVYISKKTERNTLKDRLKDREPAFNYIINGIPQSEHDCGLISELANRDDLVLGRDE